MLLLPEEQKRVKGIIINKFRGDVKLLEPGLKMLEGLIHVPVVGVVPWMDVELEDEDSVTERFHQQTGIGSIDVVVVRLPHISNFTDFQALSLHKDIKVRYAQTADDLANADVVILPGTKNTIEDLAALRQSGMDVPILRHARSGKLLMGICGGYQMLGNRLFDPDHVESDLPEIGGLGLLDMDVYFQAEKQTVQSLKRITDACLWMHDLSGAMLDGYEIHSGSNAYGDAVKPWLVDADDNRIDGIMNAQGNVLGSYLHGLFDNGLLIQAIVREVQKQKGLSTNPLEPPVTMEEFRDKEFDRVADIVRTSLSMERIYTILRGDQA